MEINAGLGICGWDCTRHFEKRLSSALFLTAKNLANSIGIVKDEATVDAYGYVVFMLSDSSFVRKMAEGLYCILAWALTLLVLLYRAMREPLAVGRATGTDSPRFSFIISILTPSGAGRGNLKPIIMRIQWHIHRLLVLLSCIVALQPLFAEEFEYQDFKFSFNPGDSTCTLIQGDYQNLTEAIIPDTAFLDVTPYEVTCIGPSAFSNCTNLINVRLPLMLKEISSNSFDNTSLTRCIIPKGVTHIDSYSFRGCKFTNINLPDSLQYISHSAFDNCDLLTSFEISESNKNYVTVDGVLYNAEVSILMLVPKGKSDVIIPETVKEIGNYSFESCIKISRIELPSNVKRIGIRGFYDCKSLSEIFLGSVTEILDYAFEKTSLTKINLPASFSRLGDAIFSECYQLLEINVSPDNPHYSSIDGVLYNKNATTVCAVPKAIKSVNLPETVESIRDFAFTYCQSLHQIKLPSSLTHIGFAAFNATNLETISLPKVLTTIEDYSFGDKIKSVYIPKSVAEIGNYAFPGCTALFLSNATLYIAKDAIDNKGFIYISNQYVSRIVDIFEGTNITVKPMPEIHIIKETFVQHGSEDDFVLGLDGGEIFNSLQFDVTLPNGIELVENGDNYAVSLNSDATTSTHSVTASRLQSGDYRVVIFSSENANFLSGENLLSMRMCADDTFEEGTAKIHNIVAPYETTAVELADSWWN